MADNQSILDKANTTAKAVSDNVEKATGSCWIAGIMAGLVWLAMLAIPELFLIVAWLMSTIGIELIDAFVEGFRIIRDDKSQAMNTLIGDTMGEFFGADFNTSNLSTQPGQDTNLANMQAIGADIFGLLQSEFAPNGTIDEDQGQKGAEAFVGFATNFAVRSAIVGLLGEILSLGKIEDFRELGSEIAQNLGLGRLIRRALTPLIQTTIATPLQWNLNRQYRPKRLSEAQMFLGFQQGVYTEEQFTDALRQMGYRDTDVEALVKGLTAKNSVVEIAALQRHNILDHDTSIQRLRDVGFSLDAATRALIAADCERADHWVQKIVMEYGKLYEQGEIDQGQFDQFIETLPLGDIETSWVEETFHLVSKTPHRVLTVGMELKALEESIITLDEFQHAILQLGFSIGDEFTLEQIGLLAIAAAKAKAAKAKGKTSTSTSTTPPPAPPAPPAPVVKTP